MNRDLVARDVFLDPIVGGRRAPHVVLGLEPVDRDDNLQPGDFGELGGNRTHRARHELRVDAARREQRQQLLELAVPHERLAADDRYVKWLLFVDDGHEPVDQLLAFVVGDLSQRDVAAEVLIAVCVAAGAAQRTLAGDFDRE